MQEMSNIHVQYFVILTRCTLGNYVQQKTRKIKRQQREVMRLLGVVKCLIKFLFHGDAEITLSKFNK
jgi:hypothetical protein